MDIHDLSAEDILYSRDVDKRMAEARDRIAQLMMGPQDDDAMDEVQDLSEELSALREFRNSVTTPYTRGWGSPGGMSFVRESYWETYAASIAHDIYGEAAETPYWNRREFATDQLGEYEAATLDGITYLYNGR